MSKIDILNSLNVPGQIPLNAKGFVLTLDELKDLGQNNVKAYSYYEDMLIHCVETHEDYKWKEVVGTQSEADKKLLDTDFTYPANSVAYGIDYSGRTFNLFLSGNRSNNGGYENENGTFTWQVFADDIKGTNISVLQLESSNFAGFAYNQINRAIDLSDPSIFLFIPLTSIPGRDGIDGANGIGGLDGENGIQGPDGLNGAPTYFHVAYADDINGGGFSLQPFDKKFIGTYSDYNPIKSNDPADYTWQEVAGVDGTNGLPGYNGDDGLTYYLHVAYANSADGVTDFDIVDSVNKLYIGTLVDLVEADSTNPVDYSWSKIRSALDEGGIDDGTGTFTWIKYSIAKDGSAPLQDSSNGMRYMGIALEQATREESNNYQDYEWHLINVETEINGINQNNFVRVIPVFVEDIFNVTEETIAQWVEDYGMFVLEDEIVLFDIKPSDDIVSNPVIDESIPLQLSYNIVDNTTVDFSWVDNDPAIIQYKLINIKDTDTTRTNTLTTEKVIQLTGLDDGESYTAYLEGYDLDGNIKTSNIVNYTLFEDAGTPVVLQVAQIFDTIISLRWDIDASVIYDKVEIYQVGVGKIHEVTGVSLIWTQFNVTGLTPETEYSFYAIAYDGVTPLPQSNTVTETTLATVNPPLTAPTITYISHTSTSVKFDITISPLELNRITAFKVFYRIKGLTEWADKIVSKDLVQIFDGLEIDTTYELKIQSVENNNGTEIYSPDSNIIEFTTLSETGLTGYLIPDESTNYIYDFYIVGGQPFQEVEILLRGVLITETGASWTAVVCLETLGVCSPNLASPGSTLPTEFHKITLDANGEYTDRFKLSGGPIDYLSYPGFKITGTIQVYDFNNEPAFSFSVTAVAPF